MLAAFRSGADAKPNKFSFLHIGVICHLKNKKTAVSDAREQAIGLERSQYLHKSACGLLT